MKSNLKRRAKELAVRSANSSLGSSPRMTKEILRTLRIEYSGNPGRIRTEGARKAHCCITIDFDVTVPSRFEDNRKGTFALLGLADKHQIPVTWAVCGKSAEGDMKSFSAISDSSTNYEIGVHTYSHIDASASTRDTFLADLERCIQVLGLRSPRSFVFPWNRESHHDVLVELGFKAFRGKKRAIGFPAKESGLWNIRPVYYVDQKSLGAESLIKAYIDLCISNSATFHLWSHPWSLPINGRTEPMAATIGSVFEYLEEKRNEGTIDTLTMGSLASLLEFSAAQPLAPPGRSAFEAAQSVSH